VLTVLDRTELAGGSRVAAGSRAQSRMSVSEEAIHRVRWSCAPPEPEVRSSKSACLLYCDLCPRTSLLSSYRWTYVGFYRARALED
jgi:hypothetical protein